MMLNQIAEVALTTGDASARHVDPRAHELDELPTNSDDATHGVRHERVLGTRSALVTRRCTSRLALHV
jgi:hypothetical protein